MKERIASCIDNLKHLPGVYLMHDINDKIIYVGKAKDLYKRVSQYFLRPQVGKVMKMVEEAEYFETIITNNEKEALILEMNLIQTHYPKFNILLMDDKHYPYIALKKGSNPYLVIKRNNKDNKYTYFGPFPNSTAAYEMVDLLNKLFPIRKCNVLPKTPCLYYHLGQCLGPCINKIDEKEYEKIIIDIKNFLSGDNKDKYKEIEDKMIKASEEEKYELAQSYKNILDAINHINIKQSVELKDKIDRDVFAYSVRENYFSLAVLLYRKGVLLGNESYVVELFGEPQEFMMDLILQFYEKHNLPKEIIINNKDIIDGLTGLLDCDLVMAARGKIYELVEKAKLNADNALDEYFISARLNDDNIALLEELGHLLNINTPYHIELFDNSHIQGSSPVGAMVAFINGEPAKKLYRKFKIEHEEARDDLASMLEVTSRHYTRLKENKAKLPDLIFVDGGLNQTKAVYNVISALDLPINVFGLYKNDKHQTDGIIDINGNTYPINNKKLFFLLTRMQDEVHRFAITYHRSKRNKMMSKSILDDINGLGIKRKEIILKAYPDINILKQVSIEELSQLVPLDVAKRIKEKLNS